MEPNDLKILAIDDNQDHQTLLKMAVSTDLPGAAFRAASDGPGGIELALSEDPDVILLDIVLPGIDGFEVCRMLKGDERLAHIPVLFMTAFRSDTVDRVKALEAGAEGFLAKPIEEAELIAQVRAMARIKAANRLQKHKEEELSALVAERTRELEKELAERKRVEAELQRHAAELEERVSGRTAELEAKNRELESFTYSVSHDLKAPLRAIAGYSSLVLEDHAERLDEDGRGFLQRIHAASLRMDQLIEDLLAYARLESRHSQAGPVNPRKVVEALLAGCEDEVRERGLAVTVDIPFEAITADPDGLALALRNLVDNAIKFTRDTPDPCVEIGGRESQTAHLLWVRDNGIGFDMKHHDRIYEIFQRLHGTEAHSGTGIGLAIVRKAVGRMGGRTWAESEPGKGATFYLEVPR